MPGLDRRTGRSLEGFAGVVQSIDVIFTTRIGARVMRRWFGCEAPALLGRMMSPRLFLTYMTALAVALDLWEPRFRVTRIIAGKNTADELRLGHLSLVIEGEYRPRAHLGDLRAEGARRVLVAGRQTALRFMEM